MSWAKNFITFGISIERQLQQAGKLEWMNDWWVAILEPGHFLSYYVSEWTGAGKIDEPTYDTPKLTSSPGTPVGYPTGLVFLSGKVVRQNDFGEEDFIKLIVDFGIGEWDEILATSINYQDWDTIGSVENSLSFKYEHLGTAGQSGVTNLFTEDACNYRNHTVVEYKLKKNDDWKTVSNIIVVARTRKCLEIGQDIGGTESFTRNPAQILWDHYLKKKKVDYATELAQYENDWLSLEEYCGASVCHLDPNYYQVNVPYPSANLVKSTSHYRKWYAKHIVDQDMLATGQANNVSWKSSLNQTTNQRINFDFGRKVVITRLEINNYHTEGGSTTTGIQDFALQGSNTASDLDYTTYADGASGWTDVHAGLTAAEHSAADEADWEQIEISNTTGYRYYSLKIANNYGATIHMGIRNLRFYTGNAASACTGDETNIRHTFDFNFNTEISINDLEKLICRSCNCKIIKSQGVYKPVWRGAEEADGAGSLQARASKHAFVVGTNTVEKTLRWNHIDKKNLFRVNFLDSSDKFKKCSDAEIKNEVDIAARGEELDEENCEWIIDSCIATRRAKLKYNKSRYTDYIGGFIGFPSSQHLELFDRVTCTATLPGWSGKDFLIGAKEEDDFGRSQFVIEAYLSGIYQDNGFEIQPSYPARTININEPIPPVDPDTVTVTNVTATAGDSYAVGSIRVQWTIAQEPTYGGTRIHVSTDNLTYRYTGITDADGDAYIDGLGRFWDYGDTVYIKLENINGITFVSSGLSGTTDGQVTIDAKAKTAGFYTGQYDLWGGDKDVTNAATSIVLGGLDVTPKMALGESADLMTLTNHGTYPGFYVDGTGAFRGGSGTTYVQWNVDSGELTIEGAVIASTSDIAGTAADTFTINSDLDNTTAKLILGRTTGGNAEIEWAGSYVTIDQDTHISGNLGVNDYPLSTIGIYNIFTSLDTINAFTGFYGNFSKTAGVSNYDDTYRNFYSNFNLNQSGGVFGTFLGIENIVTLTLGTVGAAGNERSLYGIKNTLDLNGGEVTLNNYGIYIDIDQEAGNTIDGDAYSIYINESYDGTVTGTAYGIYQNGTAPNVLGGTLQVTDHVGIGTAPIATVGLYQYDNAIDTAATYRGIYNYNQKTAGSSDYSDNLFGLDNRMFYNQTGGEIGNFYGLYNFAYIVDGTIGTIGNEQTAYGIYNQIRIDDGEVTNDLNGIYNFLNLDGGTIDDDVRGYLLYIGQEAGNTISGNVYGLFINISLDGTVTDTAYQIYLANDANLDYGIYQASTAPNVFSGNIVIADDNYIGSSSEPTTLQIDSSGNVILSVGDIGTDNFLSQTTGWQVTYAGVADFRELYADELFVKAFTAEVYSALAGGIIITKSRAEVTRDFTIPDTSSSATLYVSDLEGLADTAVFVANDYVRLRVLDRSGGGLVVTDIYGQVTAYSDETGGEQSWTFTTTTAGYSSADVIYAGSIVLDYGQTGSGSTGVWEVTVLDPSGNPYSQIQTWDTVTDGEPDNFVTWVRTGNLDGIAGVGTEYGLYAGDSDGKANDAQYILLTDQQFAIHNIPIELHDGTSLKIKLDPTAPSIAAGMIAPTDYLTGDGFWVGVDSGTSFMGFHLGDIDGEVVAWSQDTGTLKIGVLAGEHIQLDGSTLAFYNNTDKMAELSGTTWTLGDTDNEYVKISTSGTQIYDGATLYATYGATTTIGLTAGEHINIISTAVQIKNGATVYTDLTNGVLTLGDSSNEHAILDTSGLTLYDGATYVARFAATTYLGDWDTGVDYLELSATGFDLVSNSVSVFSIGVNGEGSLNMIAGADITLKGNDSDPAKIIWDGTDNDAELFFNTAGTQMVWWPTVPESGALYIGTTAYQWGTVDIYGNTWARMTSYYDADDYSRITLENGDNASQMTLAVDRNGTTYGIVITNSIAITGATAITGNTTITGNLAPEADSTRVFGAADAYWATAYIDNTILKGGRPAADSSYTWGTSSYCWSNIYGDAGVTSCSDKRWKTIIGREPLGLDFVNSLSFIEYELNKNGKKRKGKFRGVIGQELEQVLIECGYNPDDFAGLEKNKDENGELWYGINYEQLIPSFGIALQQLSAEVKELKSKMNA